MKRFAPLVVVLALGFMAAVAYAGEWSGEIVKKADGGLVLSSGGKELKIANPDKASASVGQKVKVTGSVDEATGTVTVESVSAAS